MSIKYYQNYEKYKTVARWDAKGKLHFICCARAGRQLRSIMTTTE